MAQTRSKYYAKAHTANAIETYPECQAVTGTVSISANTKIAVFTGTAPNFALIKRGDWLVLKTTTAAEVIFIDGVDADKKHIFLRHEAKNTHAAVNCFIVAEEDSKGAKCHVSVGVKSTATALYINGNLINPSDLSTTKYCYEFANDEPLIVECNTAFVITNAQSLG